MLYFYLQDCTKFWFFLAYFTFLITERHVSQEKGNLSYWIHWLGSHSDYSAIKLLHTSEENQHHVNVCHRTQKNYLENHPSLS